MDARTALQHWCSTLMYALGGNTILTPELAHTFSPVLLLDYWVGEQWQTRKFEGKEAALVSCLEGGFLTPRAWHGGERFA
jgi:hypothetical protein